MSKSAIRVWKHRILVSCFTMVMLSLSMTTISVPRATAVPAAVATCYQAYVIDYFTDATHAEPCGYKYRDCSRHIHSSGCVTPYTEEECYPCGGY
jgi:hypothetical protein